MTNRPYPWSFVTDINLNG